MSQFRSKTLSLYRTILRNGNEFKDYNFRTFIKRKAKEVLNNY